MTQIFAFIIGIAIGAITGAGLSYFRHQPEPVEPPQPHPLILATSTEHISPAEIGEQLPLPAIKYNDDTSNAVCLDDCPLITP